MAARRKLLSSLAFGALLLSCKQNAAITPSVLPIAADAELVDASPTGIPVDNAIADCVEVSSVIEASPNMATQLRLRFSVIQPIYKCGCPSAAVRYTFLVVGKAVVSEQFAAMKYTDRWFETVLALGSRSLSDHAVTVGCNVQ